MGPAMGQTQGTVPAISDLRARPRYGSVPATVERPLSAHFGDMVNLLDHCPGNGIDSDQVGLTKAASVAQGRPILVVPGRQFRPEATITVESGAPFTVIGWGNGFGPGAAVQDEAATSLIRPIFGAGPVFDVQSLYPARFDNFRIDIHPNFRNVSGGYAGNTGAGIRVRGPTNNVNSSTIIRDVAIVGKNQCISLLGPFVPQITGCRFMAWNGKAVEIATYAGTEGNGGEIRDNMWFGQGMNQPGSGPCLYTEVGYTKIISNKMGGGSFAIDAAIKGGNAGNLDIFLNTMEDQYTGSARFRTQDGSTLNVSFETNWMSVLADAYAATFQQHIVFEDSGGDWLEDSTVRGNRIRSALRSSSRCVWVQTGANVDIDNNQLINLGSNTPRGIDVYGPVSSARLKSAIRVRRNNFRGVFSPKYSFAPGVASFEHFDTDMTVAQIADGTLGAVLDGSQVYASDGTPGSVTGGGTGAFYRRQGGAWNP
ncbi:hypothetical protein ACQVP2_28520 [Methylobacterium aquaticum]|uniref:hypothetical protein n=1 Tax=Methylobacterium aquaticum TaxID=270351 RepID=UPI003D172755